MPLETERLSMAGLWCGTFVVGGWSGFWPVDLTLNPDGHLDGTIMAGGGNPRWQKRDRKRAQVVCGIRIFWSDVRATQSVRNPDWLP